MRQRRDRVVWDPLKTLVHLGGHILERAVEDHVQELIRQTGVNVLVVK